jgi:hypothetical protein
VPMSSSPVPDCGSARPPLGDPGQASGAVAGRDRAGNHPDSS